MAQQDEALEAKRDEADMLREQLRQASEAYNKALQDAENLKKDLADEREKCVSLEHRLSQLWHRMSELERTAAESATELQRSRVGMAQLEEGVGPHSSSPRDSINIIGRGLWMRCCTYAWHRPV